RRSVVVPSAEWLWADPFIFIQVAQRDEKEAKRLFEAFLETRLVVEVGIARLAAQRSDDMQATQLRDLITEMKYFQEKGLIEDFAHVDLKFHTTLLESTQNVFVS